MFLSKIAGKNVKKIFLIFSLVYKIFLKIYIICKPLWIINGSSPSVWYYEIWKWIFIISLTLYTVYWMHQTMAYTFVSVSIFRDRNCTIRFNNSFSAKFLIIAQYHKRILWQIELTLSMLIVSAYFPLTIYFINIYNCLFLLNGHND